MEPGQGETAARGSDTPSAPEATGQSGQEADAGKPSRDAAAGKEPTQDGAPPRNPEAQPDAAGNPQETEPQPAESQRNDSKGGMSDGPPQGGGQPSADVPAAPQTEPTPLPEADEANLDYARQATDLVLERLKDQEQAPDPELLKSLGWTKEELQQFIARWEELKRAAREEGPSARADLDDPLRSLGLRSTDTQRRSGNSINDQPGGQRDLGRSSTPPAEFLEQFNAYRKGRSRGSSDGGARRP
jgi:hypothetical protein